MEIQIRAVWVTWRVSGVTSLKKNKKDAPPHIKQRIDRRDKSMFLTEMSGNGDVVGIWEVPLSDGVHKVEFEHGTASGKRIIRVNGKEDWMFKLVGLQEFNIGKIHCVIKIEPIAGLSYCYSLVVDGKPLEEFIKKRSTLTCTWAIPPEHRVVLEKDTLDIWVDGKKVEATGEFVDGGTETHFPIGEGDSGCIKAISSSNKREGIIYTMIYNDKIIAQDNEF